MGFDLKTIAFLFFYTNLIGSGALAFVCFNVRKRVKGTEFWLTGMMIQTCGFLFLYLREQLLFSPFTVIAISLILLGNAVFIEGFIRFVDKKFFRFYNYLLLIPIVAILYYFTFVQDLQVVRDILFSSVTAIYTIQGGALFLVDTIGSSGRLGAFAWFCYQRWSSLYHPHLLSDGRRECFRSILCRSQSNRLLRISRCPSAEHYSHGEQAFAGRCQNAGKKVLDHLSFFAGRRTFDKINRWNYL